jgi:hypothetical protein
MKTNFIEVFVEENCPACNSMLSLAQRFVNDVSVELRVFNRQRDPEMFRRRHVVICPATFVNNKLVFYGEFTADALEKHLHQAVRV